MLFFSSYKQNNHFNAEITSSPDNYDSLTINYLTLFSN